MRSKMCQALWDGGSTTLQSRYVLQILAKFWILLVWNLLADVYQNCELIYDLTGLFMAVSQIL